MGGGGRCRRHPDGDEGIRGGLLGRATLRWLAPVGLGWKVTRSRLSFVAVFDFWDDSFCMC